MTKTEIESVRIIHPVCGPARFVAVRQDRRDYYRLTFGVNGGGSLTNQVNAEDTIRYWLEQGWVKELAS